MLPLQSTDLMEAKGWIPLPKLKTNWAGQAHSLHYFLYNETKLSADGVKPASHSSSLSRSWPLYQHVSTTRICAGGCSQCPVPGVPHALPRCWLDSETRHPLDPRIPKPKPPSQVRRERCFPLVPAAGRSARTPIPGQFSCPALWAAGG